MLKFLKNRLVIFVIAIVLWAIFVDHSITFFASIALGILAALILERYRDYQRLRRLEADLNEDDLEEETLYYTNGELNVLYGDEKDFRQHFKKYVPKGPKRIMRAAVLATDGRIWSVSPPGRHHHCFEAMDVFAGQFGGKYHKVDGFVDSEGTFHDREDACRIAREAGQLFYNGIPKNDPQNELCSEDLWLWLNTCNEKTITKENHVS